MADIATGIIAWLPKNRREQVRVALDRYRGADLIDVRVCVELTSTTGRLMPTSKGVSLKIEQLPELIEALEAARAEAAPALAFADAMCRGRVGRELNSYLLENFSGIRRFDAFLGISMALTLWEMDIAIAEGEGARLANENACLKIENSTLRRQLAALRATREAA
jgi:hypothetical protein